MPGWFIIKCNPYIENGAKNTFSVMKLIRKQPKKVQEVAKKSFQTNAFFAHSSNLLLAMLVDEEEEIRRRAVNVIMKIRQGEILSEMEKTGSGLRVFRVPKLNWDAQDFTQIIDWDVESLCEPPVTKTLTEDDLRKAYAAPLDIPKHPNNSQSVEGAIKLVSEACHQVYGQERRHELCLSKQAARKENPSYTTKKNFKFTIYWLSNTVSRIIFFVYIYTSM